LIGQAYMQAGDYTNAAKYLDNASEFRPQDSQATFALGLSDMAAGQSSAALDALQSGLRSDASTSELDALLVEVQLQQRNIERAEQAWSSIHRKQPNSTTTLQLKAAILTAKKDLPGARKALEQALMLDPTFVPAALDLARLDLDENDPLNARQRLERILRADPRNADVMLALAEIGPAVKATTAEIKGWLTDAHKLKPSSARASVLLAELLLESGNGQEALEIARESVRAHPEHPGLLETLGAAQTAVGNADGALGTYATLAVLMPHSMEVLYKLAVAQAATSSNAAAAITLQKVLSQVPDHLGALSLLARLHLRGGRTDEAIALARTLQASKRTAAAGYVLEGEAMRVADPRRAVESYETALRLEPSAETVVRLHEGLMGLGRTSEADERLRRWIDERPDDWRARLYWADTMLARRNYRQAMPHYLAAVAQFPDSSRIHNNLAIAMAWTRDQRALEHAQRAYALRTNDPAILDTLGWIHMQRGELDRAIEFLERSIALRPDYWETRLHLAQAYERAKDYSKARTELEQALKADPPADRAEEMKRTLQDLPL
jgi:putative PEP-CTERM system TPR-repeat lipoprotein